MAWNQPGRPKVQRHFVCARELENWSTRRVTGAEARSVVEGLTRR